MYCPNCGKEMHQTSNFCIECGNCLKNDCQIIKNDKSLCPKCGSYDVSVGKKGYNSKAVGWTFAAFILGFLTVGIAWIILIFLLLTGFIGSNKTQWICKKCGCKWVENETLK